MNESPAAADPTDAGWGGLQGGGSQLSVQACGTAVRATDRHGGTLDAAGRTRLELSSTRS